MTRQQETKNGKNSNKGISNFKLFLLLVLGLIFIALIIYFIRDFNETSEDYMHLQDNSLYMKIFNSKAKFMKQYAVKLEQQVAEEQDKDKTTTGTGSVQYTTKAKGKLITDTTINPLGLPLYDGYTMSGEYFDVDYSRFHDMSYPNEYLRGLGDFTNPVAKNNLSIEFGRDEVTKGTPGGKSIYTDPSLEAVNGYWTVDGRFCMALPAGAITPPEIHESVIDTWWRNLDKYTDSDGDTICLFYIPGIFSADLLLGQYVDCVLENGTVIPIIVTDTKGAHYGHYVGATYHDICEDQYVDGYCHRRLNANSILEYNGILEVCVTSSRYHEVKCSHLNLTGNKIMGFRVYKNIRHFDVEFRGGIPYGVNHRRIFTEKEISGE